jgi:hypothetical protein
VFGVEGRVGRCEGLEGQDGVQVSYGLICEIFLIPERAQTVEADCRFQASSLSCTPDTLLR